MQLLGELCNKHIYVYNIVNVLTLFCDRNARKPMHDWELEELIWCNVQLLQEAHMVYAKQKYPPLSVLGRNKERGIDINFR